MLRPSEQAALNTLHSRATEEAREVRLGWLAVDGTPQVAQGVAAGFLRDADDGRQLFMALALASGAVVAVRRQLVQGYEVVE